MEEDDVEFLVAITVTEGWEIEPLALEPAELSNHISSGGSELEYLMEGQTAREFDPGSIAFGIRERTSVVDDDDTGSSGEEDLTWLYVLILVVMLGIMIGAVLWYRREE
jgi:hypothetical protein